MPVISPSQQSDSFCMVPSCDSMCECSITWTVATYYKFSCIDEHMCRNASRGYGVQMNVSVKSENKPYEVMDHEVS